MHIYEKLECIEWFLFWLDPDLNCRISLIRGPNLPLFSSVHLYIIFKKSGISLSFRVIPCQVNHYGLHVTDFAEILHTIRDMKKIPEPEDERSDLKLKKNFEAISKNKKVGAIWNIEAVLEISKTFWSHNSGLGGRGTLIQDFFHISSCMQNFSKICDMPSIDDWLDMEWPFSTSP